MQSVTRPWGNDMTKNIKAGQYSLVALAFLTGCFGAIAVQADEAEQHKERGNVYHNAGRFDDALREYRAAIRLRPNFPKAYNNIGSVYIDGGKDQLAIAPLLTAIKLDPKYAHAFYNLGKAYADTGKPQQAIAAYTQAVKLDPTDPDTLHNLGNIYERAKHWGQAIPFYEWALRLASPSTELQIDLASAYVNTGQDDQAIELYQQVFAVKRTTPYFAFPCYDFGYALADKGRHEEAIAALLQSIHLGPEDARPRVSLGIEYITIKQWDQAVETLREAVRVAPTWDQTEQRLHMTDDPTLPLAHLNLGAALSGQGNEPEARAEWQKVLALDHGALAKTARENLARGTPAK